MAARPWRHRLGAKASTAEGSCNGRRRRVVAHARSDDDASENRCDAGRSQEVDSFNHAAHKVRGNGDDASKNRSDARRSQKVSSGNRASGNSHEVRGNDDDASKMERRVPVGSNGLLFV